MRGINPYIARIYTALHAGLERRLNLLRHQQSPIDRLRKEGMLLDLLSAVHSQSSSRITSKETSQEGAGVR